MSYARPSITPYSNSSFRRFKSHSFPAINIPPSRKSIFLTSLASKTFRKTASNNYASILPMKNYSNFTITMFSTEKY